MKPDDYDTCDRCSETRCICETPAPAGSLPETGSRTRAAGSKPGDPLTSTSELPFADQGGDEIQRLLDHLIEQEAWHDKGAGKAFRLGDLETAKSYAQDASRYARWKVALLDLRDLIPDAERPE